MPFNQLILPLLGGYIFINHCYITSYWASRHSREHLIFLSAVTGAIFLVTSRFLVWCLSHCEFGVWLYEAIHRIAPFHEIGTALGAFFLGFVFLVWFNRAWNRQKSPLWLVSKGSFNKLELLLFSSVIELKPARYMKKHPWRVLIKGLFGWYRIRTLWSRYQKGEDHLHKHPIEKEMKPRPIMLCMKNRKVYVGFIFFVMPVRAGSIRYVTIVPAWSGYRNYDDMIVVPTTYYAATIKKLKEHTPISTFSKVICLDDIESANIYDHRAFSDFKSPEDNGDTQGDGEQIRE